MQRVVDLIHLVSYSTKLSCESELVLYLNAFVQKCKWVGWKVVVGEVTLGTCNSRTKFVLFNAYRLQKLSYLYVGGK